MASRLRQVAQHRLAGSLILAAALLMRLVVPGGFMLDFSNGSIAVELCSGTGPMCMTMQMPDMAHHDGDKDHGKAEQPCAFSGLTAPALGGADPILLAVAVAFIMTAAFRVAVTAPPSRQTFLRPPLRGPPTIS